MQALHNATLRVFQCRTQEESEFQSSRRHEENQRLASELTFFRTKLMQLEEEKRNTLIIQGTTSPTQTAAIQQARATAKQEESRKWKHEVEV